MGVSATSTPEELLGREPVKIADEKIYNFVNSKTVLITGGGGSIGSEICRQVAANNPKKLVLIDVYENNAYSIQQELIGKYGDKLNLEVYITTVCDYRKINSIFAAEKAGYRSPRRRSQARSSHGDCTRRSGEEQRFRYDEHRSRRYQEQGWQNGAHLHRQSRESDEHHGRDQSVCAR